MVMTESTMLSLGSPAPAFDLTDTEGNTVRKSDYDGAPLLVIFMCNHCPFVKHIRTELVAFAADAISKGVAVVGVNANINPDYPDDSEEKMKEEAQAHGFPFPYVADTTQEVAKAFRAACTPDFFLFDAEGALAYRGQFDDSRPGNDKPVTGEDLRRAVTALLAGQRPNAEQKPSIGCNIKWRPGNEPGYFSA